METKPETETPAWVKNAPRLDRPDITAWYKSEQHGALNGVLIWRGQQEQRDTGEVYNAYAIRVGEGGTVFGVSERAGLRGLRSVKLNSKVFIRPTGVKILDGGRKMQQFEIRAEGLEPLSDPPRGLGRTSPVGTPEGDPPPSDNLPF